jgi:hypothetical protein
MAKLTEAQRWALQAIADGHGTSPAYLGQRMMERPGVEEKRRGGNRNSSQGLGRVGGVMMSRLAKANLIIASGWPTKARLTPAGRAALEASR